MNTLDNILGGGEAVSEGATENEQVTQTATEAEGQTEQATEGQEAESEGNRVPVAALQAERQKVKRYTEEVADFRKQLADSNAAWERRMSQLVEAVKPKQEPQATPDQFEDGPGFVRHHVAEQVSPEFERINQTMMANAQIVAGLKYGDDKVQEAEQAFVADMKSGKLDPADYQRVVNSPNRYAAAAEWHKRQTAKAEIGDDPAAFKTRLEAEIREKLLAEFNGGQAQQTQQRQSGPTPSNLAGARNVGTRNGPAYAGPPSLNDIFNRSRSPG